MTTPVITVTECDMEEAIDELQTDSAVLNEEITELKQKEELLYRLARLARNTDGLHPSTSGPEIGKILLELRLMDGSAYALKVM